MFRAPKASNIVAFTIVTGVIDCHLSHHPFAVVGSNLATLFFLNYVTSDLSIGLRHDRIDGLECLMAFGLQDYADTAETFSSGNGMVWHTPTALCILTCVICPRKPFLKLVVFRV